MTTLRKRYAQKHNICYKQKIELSYKYSFSLQSSKRGCRRCTNNLWQNYFQGDSSHYPLWRWHSSSIQRHQSTSPSPLPCHPQAQGWAHTSFTCWREAWKDLRTSLVHRYQSCKTRWGLFPVHWLYYVKRMFKFCSLSQVIVAISILRWQHVLFHSDSYLTCRKPATARCDCCLDTAKIYQSFKTSWKWQLVLVRCDAAWSLGRSVQIPLCEFNFKSTNLLALCLPWAWLVISVQKSYQMATGWQ